VGVGVGSGDRVGADVGGFVVGGADVVARPAAGSGDRDAACGAEDVPERAATTTPMAASPTSTAVTRAS
jgi:hypothetical protein